MTERLIQWRGPSRRALLLVLSGALIAMPVTASESGPVPKVASKNMSVSELASREAARTSLTPATVARRAEQASTRKGASGFFKSRPGAIALVVMAVGTGYAVYSSKHDRITSPAKK